MSPAVNLALEEVPFAILEAVKARILANRRRLGVGRDGERPPPSLKPRPQLRKFGASSKSYRRPEPAATGGGGNYQVLWIAVDDTSSFDGNGQTVRYVGGFIPDPNGTTGVVAVYSDFYHPPVFSNPPPGSSKKFTIFSLNRQPALEVEFPYPAAQYYYDAAVAKYILPIDGNNLILVLGMFTRSNASEDGTNVINVKCFKVGKNAVRQIEAPLGAAFNTLKEVVYDVGDPPYRGGALQPRTHGAWFSATFYQSRSPITYFSRAKFGDIYPALFDDVDSHMPFDKDSDKTYGNFTSYGPGIYTFLLNPDAAYAAIDEGGTEGNVLSAYSVIGNSNLPEGNYAVSMLDGTFSQRLKFTSTIDDSTYESEYAPVNGLENPVWQQVKSTIKSPKPENPYTGRRSLVFPNLFWNWDEPDYCKEKLLQCGFKPEDLI